MTKSGKVLAKPAIIVPPLAWERLRAAITRCTITCSMKVFLVPLIKSMYIENKEKGS